MNIHVKHQWTEDDDKLLLGRVEAGEPYSEIGRRFGVSKSAVSGRIRRLRQVMNAAPWTREDEAKVLKMVRAGKTLVQIGVAVQRSTSAVNAHLVVMRKSDSNVPTIGAHRPLEVRKNNPDFCNDRHIKKLREMAQANPYKCEPVPFSDLRDDQCRCTVDGTSGALMMCCAAPVVDAMTRGRKATHCQHHLDELSVTSWHKQKAGAVL